MAASNKLRRVSLRLNLKTSRINIWVVSLCSKRLMQTPGSECTGIHWHSFSVMQGLWTPASGHPVEANPGPDAMRCRVRKVLYGMSALCKHGENSLNLGNSLCIRASSLKEFYTHLEQQLPTPGDFVGKCDLHNPSQGSRWSYYQSQLVHCQAMPAGGTWATNRPSSCLSTLSDHRGSKWTTGLLATDSQKEWLQISDVQ